MRAPQVLAEQRAERFRMTVASLARLCACIEAVLAEAEGRVGGPSDGRAAGGNAHPAGVEASWERLLATQPPERLLDVRALFDAKDVDGSGAIGVDEVATIVRELGYAPSQPALAAIFDAMDIDGSGQVSFSEFATVVFAPALAGACEAAGRPAAEQDAASREAWAKIYRFFDSDGSGAIDQAEMLCKLEALGFDLRGVAKLFADIAGPQKGTVSEKDFVRYLERSGLNAATEAA